MSNPDCDVIISVGPNKGRRCGDAGRRCLHGTFMCEWCHKKLGNSGSMNYHLMSCRKALDRKTEAPGVRASAAQASEPLKAIAALQTKADELLLKHPLYGPLVRPRGCINLDALEYLHRMQEPRNVTIVHNHVVQNINVQNVNVQQNIQQNIQQNVKVIFYPDFYSQLINQRGPIDTHKYVADLASKRQPLKIVEDLYLNPEQPTVIARGMGDHFRYMIPNGTIIDDPDGKLLVDMIKTCLENAFLSSANAMISGGQLTGDADPEVWDQFRVLNNYALDVGKTLDRSSVLAYIKGCIAINDDHPFFSDPLGAPLLDVSAGRQYLQSINACSK